METTNQEKSQLRTIIQNLIAGDKQWFEEYQILVGDKGPFWILNYRQGPRNEYNRLVRGMVVQKPAPGFSGDALSLIKSFPFIRFYNQGEADAAPVDLSNSYMLEKMDGTMVGVFFPTGDHTKPEFHTRKMLSTHKDDMNRSLTTFHGMEVSFMPLIKKYVDQLQFSPEDAQYTFVFEFVHEASYVLTKYSPERYGLHLLGARNVVTHREYNEDECDPIARRIGSHRARHFDALSDNEAIQNMFAQMAKETPDFEGFIFRDRKTGARIKVKDPKYVEKHHLIDQLSFKRIIPLVLKGEEDEIIAYFPSAKKLVDMFKAAYDKYLDHVVKRVLVWAAKGLDGRRLAVALHGENPLAKWELRLRALRGQDASKPKPVEPDEFVRNMILKYAELKDEDKIRRKIDQELKIIGIGQGTNLGSPKELISMIGLHDDEEDETPLAGTDVSEI